jgi:C_GCAxxG_C_C family probable redox protein
MMAEKDKEKAMQKAYELAHQCEYDHHGCSQCVILALQDVFDLRDDGVFKAASGVSGGLGQMHDTCGALLGASLVLGQIYGRGRDELENTDKLMDSMLPVGMLYKWFEKEYGGVKCREVRAKTLGVYWDTKIPWQREEALKAGLYDVCSHLAGNVARKAAEMLWKAINARNKKI